MEAPLTQPYTSERQPYSWIDRLLRNKVQLHTIASQHDDNNVIDAADWERRGGRGSVAVFYNIFISPPPNEANAISIVEEQITTIGQSVIASQPLTLYYNLMGNTKGFNEAAMTVLCSKHSPNLDCRLLHMYESASENVTLQAMLDYCHDHPDDRVTYLHTKGAFHASDKNTHWRRLLTKAAIHPDCVRPPSADCNLCGLQFFTQFTFFVPGNMFTADCSYVQNLLPLDLYRQRQEERVKEMLLLKLQNQLRSSIVPDQLDFFGMDRYADEHWIGSHPNVRPCDLDPFSDIARIFNGTLSASQFEWKLAPRVTGVVGGIGDDLQVVVRNNTDLRRREILLLPGLIQRWWKLYQQMPKESSWIWSFFPDAEFWRQAIRRFGPDRAVHEATAKYRYTVDGSSLVSGFRPVEDTNGNGGNVLPSELTVEDTSNTTYSRAVFYHIMLHETDKDSITQVTNLIDQQLALVSSSSSAQVTLWYTIAASQATQNHVLPVIQNYCDGQDHVRCRYLGSFDDAYEGESLRSLHHYCTLHPGDRVSYIHTMPPAQLRMSGSNDNLMHSLTRAALSEECLDSVQDTCNVCGLIFYNLWTHFFPGNMFTADCNYVRKLTAPHLYETQMNEFIRNELLPMKLRNILVTEMFSERADILGLGRHSLDYWIGSHPELTPCDLSTEDLSIWSTHRDVDFDWGMAPRHFDQVPFYVQRTVVEHESQRLREYSLLPGHILRWNYFYGQTPGPFSWQWFTAPDGLKWLQAIHDYGNRSVLALTAKYAKDVY